MRHLRLALATAALLTLSGCFDLLQEFWFHADGSARVVVDVGVPKTLLHLAGRDPVVKLRAEAQRVEAALKEDPAVTSFRFKDHEAAGQHHLGWELEVSDATRLPELFRKAMAQSEIARDNTAPPVDFTVERTGFGDLVFVQRLAKAGGGAAPDQEEVPDFGRNLAAALLAGRYVTVRVHGPAIGESNGTVSEKREQVEWRIPLTDLMADAPPLSELRAVVKTGAPLWLWAAFLGVPLLLLWAAVAAMKRRRRAPPGGESFKG